MMSIKEKYFRKKGHIHDEDRELIQQARYLKKYSKGAMYIGGVALGLTGISYILCGEPNFQTLGEPINYTNSTQLLDAGLFCLSSLGLVGGGLIYGLAKFMQKDHSDHLKNERRNNLEKDLKD
jgi:hypothetical protein